MTVYSEQSEKLGTIHNFMVNKLTGQVDYVVLSFGGLLGLGADHCPLPWDMLDYVTRLDGYVVDIPKDAFKDAPHYGAGQAPLYDRAYGERIHSHYGLDYPY